MNVWAAILFASFLATSSGAKPRDERPYPPMKREPTPFVVVTNHVHIPTLWKFNPVFWFDNYDRPMPPPSFWPESKHRRLRWLWRNPFHNFDFYVIGIADKTLVREGKYPDRVFAPEEGWNWAVCKYKCLRLPFVSYHRGSFNFYLGWRNRGQFGFEFKFSEPKPSKSKPVLDRAETHKPRDTECRYSMGAVAGLRSSPGSGRIKATSVAGRKRNDA